MQGNPKDLWENLTFENLCDGALPELLAHEIEAVARNIEDLNTAAEKPRRITIELDFVPIENRHDVTVRCQMRHRIVPVKRIEGKCVIGRVEGRLQAMGLKYKQDELFRKSPVVALPDPKTAPAT